jgi:hypothetical protein
VDGVYGAPMADPPHTLRYQLQPQELAVALFDHSPVMRSSATRTKAMGAAALLVGAIFIGQTGVAAAWLAVGLLIFGLGTRFSIVRRNEWVTRRTPFLTDPVAAVADDQGVRFTTPHSDLWYRWSNYASARDTPTGVALVTRGGATVRWIPSRAFDGADHQAAWFAQARDGIAWSAVSGLGSG